MKNSYAKLWRSNRENGQRNKKASPIRIITADLNLIVKAKTNIILQKEYFFDRCMAKWMLEYIYI